MAHRHRQRAVGARLRRQPVVGELDVLGVVRRDDHDLLAAVARLDHEVRVGRARGRQVGAPDQQVAGVPPVAGLGHVGLIAERLRRGRRQIGVPVVERQDHPADQRQEARPGGVGGHRHRRDRREPHHPVGAVALDRVDVRRRDHLDGLVPGGAHEAALAALALVAAAPARDRRRSPPTRRRGRRAASRASRNISSRLPADVRVLQPQRRVRVPGERRAARAAARLVLRHVRTRRGIVDRLRLPGDQALLDVHVPRARARAVHPVGGAHDLVVLPAPAVRALPIAILGDELTPALLRHRTAAQEAVRLQQRAARMGARGLGVTGRRSLAGAHGSTRSCVCRRMASDICPNGRHGATTMPRRRGCRTCRGHGLPRCSAARCLTVALSSSDIVPGWPSPGHGVSSSSSRAVL